MCRSGVMSGTNLTVPTDRSRMTPAGYLHPDYAASLSEVGSPLLLPASEGWVLRRPIPGTASFDAMGCYPLFCCVNWAGLPQDLETLGDLGELVSLVVVPDPLGGYSLEQLNAAFDHVVPFKDHFVVETGKPLSEFVNNSHRAHAMRALKRVSVELCPEPLVFLDDWERLYRVLVARHSISGLRRFSRVALAKQLAIPGMVMFRAVAGGRTVGLDLWYAQGDCAQGHLAAFDAHGYELRASYATKWTAIDYFNERVKWINLGGATTRDPEDGLIRFKRGWSTETRTAWMCGRVLRPTVYADIARLCRVAEGGYFPIYRSGEFD
jgi:hypothetical protein